jgi:lipopolysaccharide transport system permease protein
MLENGTASELPVSVYSPEPLLGKPSALLKSIARDLNAGRELAWRLFIRDMSAQYRQTILGYVWAFLPPLVASSTFIFLNSQGIVKIDTGGLPYPAFVMIGTLLWQVFVDAVSNPSQSLVAAKPMLAKINFPREAILMGGMYMVIFNFLIRLLLVAIVMVIWKIPVDTKLMFFPVAVVGLMVCGMAFGLLLAPLGALYGDIAKGIPIIMQIWMLLTPVVYPARTTGLAGVLATWNPISPIIVTARECLTAHTFSVLPAFGVVTVLSFVVLFIGLVGFRIAMPHLIARMGG